MACGQVREIWLSSEDTGAYGRDVGTDIAQLLNMLTLTIDEARAVTCTSLSAVLDATNASAHSKCGADVFAYCTAHLATIVSRLPLVLSSVFY